VRDTAKNHSINSCVMAQSCLATDPLVSVVTPFFNTAPYLAECIESVLAQSYSNFEYILLDNCSTDGSTEIANNYARQDSRICVIRSTEFVSQLDNYNRALGYISDDSLYCKIVQADDWIFPNCIESMVRLFKQSDTIGLVSSYWLEGNLLCGSGFPIDTPIISGRQWAAHFLRTDTFVFGSMSQVMYRSSIIRLSVPFYNTLFKFGADVEKDMEILHNFDFGFVNQVLSFTRRGNDGSIFASQLSLYPHSLLRYAMARRYAHSLLNNEESRCIIYKYKREYYEVLASAVFRFRGRAFWRYHKSMLRAQADDNTLDWLLLATTVARKLLSQLANPGLTIEAMLRFLSQRRGKQIAGPQNARTQR
jgi:glycosyltransferase involved in cell wall biosynthesis